MLTYNFNVVGDVLKQNLLLKKGLKPSRALHGAESLVNLYEAAEEEDGEHGGEEGQVAVTAEDMAGLGAGLVTQEHLDVLPGQAPVDGVTEVADDQQADRRHKQVEEVEAVELLVGLLDDRRVKVPQDARDVCKQDNPLEKVESERN